MRLERDGPNCLTPPPEIPEWKKFLLQFKNFFAILLIVGSLFAYVGFAINSESPDNLYIGVVLDIVVLITAIFGYYQERNASDIMKQFKTFLPPQTVAVRNGEPTTVEASDLVVGDIVQIKAGDKIPADIRVIKLETLQVDNASLTGESLPEKRTIHCTNEKIPLQSKNMCYYGTLCVKGTGTGIVVKTGDNTAIGQIAGLVSSCDDVETPIKRDIGRFVHLISYLAIGLGVTFFIVGVALAQGVVNSLLFMIGIIVANVPEGLLVTVTVSLSLTAKRMKDQNVLVKVLESVETLGSTTLIASDKTGTLTQNRMTVTHVAYDNTLFDCETSTKAATFDESNKAFDLLRLVATVCSTTRFEVADVENKSIPINQRRCIGDASETALLKFVEPLVASDHVRTTYPKIAELPFNSENKFMVTLVSDPHDDRVLLLMKGGADRVFDKCTTLQMADEIVPFSGSDRVRVRQLQEEVASLGERVFGFAYTYLDKEMYPKTFEFDCGDLNFPVNDLTFLGLASLVDPPRGNVPAAVKLCQTAGIRVMMVTGDYKLTAAAIAREVNIIQGMTVEDIAKQRKCSVDQVDPMEASAVVVEGSELDALTDEDWDRILAHREVVFARTSPRQKLQIVEANQRRGDIVAVTGDGVNDSPALQKAHIGVAMGIAGSDVSKEAADMVLLDDNFASIVNGVKEGRLIFDNLKKSIAYTLTSNIPEILPFLLFITVGMPLPLSTILILCVDLGTDMVPAISLAYEEPESDIMLRPPRKPLDKLVTAKLMSFAYLQIGVIQALAGVFVYMVVLMDNDLFPEMIVGNGLTEIWEEESIMINGVNMFTRMNALFTAQTAYFVSIVIVQWADLLICKTRKLSIFTQGLHNRFLNIGLLSETALACLLSYAPFLNQVLFTRPIRFTYWVAAVPFSILIFIYDESRKYIIRRNPDGWVERFTYY